LESNASRGFVYSLLGTICLAGGTIAAKYALWAFNPSAFSAVWTISATAFCLTLVVAGGQARALGLSKSAAWALALMGVFTAVQMLMGWAALAVLDPSFTAFLWRFHPVMTIVLAAVFLGERLMVREVLAVAIMVGGGAYGAVGRWEIVGTGVILTLAACTLMAGQFLIGKMQVSVVPPLVMAFYRSLIAAVGINAWTILTGQADFSVSGRYWLSTALGALLGPCVGVALTFKSYRYWHLSRSSIVLTCQPLFVLPLAYVLLDQFPVRKELIGGCLILAGAFWLALIHLRRKTVAKGC